jgi:hypothetical protein
MTDTENVSVLLRGVGDKRELRIAASRATELEDMSLVLDDIDVDVSATERHYTSTSVYRVLVLSDLDSGIQLIWSHLVTSKIVKIQPVRLPTLAGYDTHTSHICTFENICGQELEGTGSKVFVCTIELCLFPGHEKVNWRDLAI